uniref:Helix-turn-helix domain-containing protein n=1 Tax=Klebsiella pneumoniae TaxID=573 RepID=A0A385ELA4_KLEPN|nr:helix-turn-helix domain-containing protein [Klebsiella pneumoniae]
MGCLVSHQSVKAALRAFVICSCLVWASPTSQVFLAALAVLNCFTNSNRDRAYSGNFPANGIFSQSLFISKQSGRRLPSLPT